MSDGVFAQVAILVGGRWTEVREPFDVVRERWESGLKTGSLIELTAWDGLMLFRPCALDAICQPCRPDEIATGAEVLPDVDDGGRDEGEDAVIRAAACQSSVDRPGRRRVVRKRRGGGR